MVPTTDPKDCQEQCKTPPKRNTDVSWGQAWGYKWVFLLICLVRAPCLTLALCWKLLWVFLFVSFLSGTSKGYLESPSCVCVLASCCQERAICPRYVLCFVLSSHTVITACFSHQALLVSTGAKAFTVPSKPTHTVCSSPGITPGVSLWPDREASSATLHRHDFCQCPCRSLLKNYVGAIIGSWSEKRMWRFKHMISK